MSQNIQDQIRERAYHLWLQNGCRNGEADQHWLTAEREVLAAFAATAKPASGQPRVARSAKKEATVTEIKPQAKARRRA